MSAFVDVLVAFSPSIGGFAGSFVAMYIWCPNHRCCQMKTVHRVLETPGQKKE